jgi:alanine dehydrogenase
MVAFRSSASWQATRPCHYVAKMPGAVPITSTFALTNAMMPYIMLLAEEGVHATLQAPAS